MKPEEAVRRAKWQLDYYRKDGIVPVDCATLSALLEGLEAAVECIPKKCVNCCKRKGWNTCKEAAFVSDGEVCLNFQWRDPCAENAKEGSKDATLE